MNYENNSATIEWLQKEYFNLLLVAFTKMGKPVKAQELSDILEFSKRMASVCANVVRNEPAVQKDEKASQFWNSVFEKL